MTILVTGFSSFPGAPENPTLALVASLEGMRTPSGESIATAILPVEWSGTWPTLERAIADAVPRAVVLFGLHAGARRLRLELVARNRRRIDAPDAAGLCAAGETIDDGEALRPGHLPWGRVAAALRAADVDFEWSRDAGRYLCNDTYYRFAAHAARLAVADFGFVHVPLSDEAAALLAETGRDGEAMGDVCRTLPAATLVRAAVAILGAV